KNTRHMGDEEKGTEGSKVSKESTRCRKAHPVLCFLCCLLFKNSLVTRLLAWMPRSTCSFVSVSFDRSLALLAFRRCVCPSRFLRAGDPFGPSRGVRAFSWSR